MQKKKVLIVIDNLHTGGIATSLYNLLYHTSQKVDYDLLVFNDESIEKDNIPKNVRILAPQKMLMVLGMSQGEIKSRSFPLYVIRMLLVAISRLLSGEVARNILFLVIKKLKNYDIAISYAQDNAWKSLSKGCNDFVIKKVNAKKKVAYIHCDYSNYGGYHPKQRHCLRQFNNIACVSRSCSDSFISKFPDLKDKTITCENFTNVDLINIRRKEYPVEYTERSINFVTVCRISTVKGLDRALRAFTEAKKRGLSNFTWTIVGEGPERGSLQEQVNKAELNNVIRLVGNKDNPYPYIAGATVFLLPSLHEAAPMVFGEAAALHIPILTTNTCSAKELVDEKKLGIVMENNQECITNNIIGVIEGNIKLFINEIQDINRNAHMQFNKMIGPE